MMGKGPMQPGTWPGYGSPTQTLARLPHSNVTGEFAAGVGIVVVGMIDDSMLFSSCRQNVSQST